MATWPSYADITVQGFSQQRQPAVLRTEMESGPPKQSKNKSRVMLTRTINVQLNSLVDYNNFISWFTATINRGNDWFDWLDPVTNTTKQARIVGGIIDSESPRTIIKYWALTMKLETWDA